MRIKLKNGKQRELILLAKKNLTWKQLGRKLNLHSGYLTNELRNEKRLISQENYNKLCRIADINFDKFILKKLDNNWGVSKGGSNSLGSIITIKIPKRNKELAEFIGAVLGDGNINYYKKGKKIGTYQIKIAGHSELDKDYHMNYLKNIGLRLFGLAGKEILCPTSNGRFLSFSSKRLVEFFIKEGLNTGDKIKNQLTIPKWIFEDKNYLRACVRGLIDTDGSIFRMSNQDPNLLRINFANHNFRLLTDAREAFIQLGFHPSKMINNQQFFLSRKEDVTKYLKDIGFSNKKHQNRLKQFIAL